MKRFIFGTMFIALTAACSHPAQPPVAPHNQVAAPVAVKPTCDENCEPKTDAKDGFDVAGEAVASGSRWTWDAAKKTYQWAGSKEHKEEARQKAEELKHYIDEAMKDDKKAP